VPRWGRRYCPDILLGVHTRQEMEDSEPRHIGFDRAKDVTPRLAERLTPAGENRFADEATLAGIETALNEARGEVETT
jgi:hypothetical protein